MTGWGYGAAAVLYLVEVIVRQAMVFAAIVAAPLIAIDLRGWRRSPRRMTAVRWALTAILIKPALTLALIVGIEVAPAGGLLALVTVAAVLVLLISAPVTMFQLLAFLDPRTATEQRAAGRRPTCSGRGVRNDPRPSRRRVCAAGSCGSSPPTGWSVRLGSSGAGRGGRARRGARDRALSRGRHSTHQPDGGCRRAGGPRGPLPLPPGPCPRKLGPRKTNRQDQHRQMPSGDSAPVAPATHADETGPPRTEPVDEAWSEACSARSSASTIEAGFGSGAGVRQEVGGDGDPPDLPADLPAGTSTTSAPPRPRTSVATPSPRPRPIPPGRGRPVRSWLDQRGVGQRGVGQRGVGQRGFGRAGPAEAGPAGLADGDWPDGGSPDGGWLDGRGTGIKGGVKEGIRGCCGHPGWVDRHRGDQ